MMEVGKTQCNLPVSTQPNKLHQQPVVLSKENEVYLKSMEIDISNSKSYVYSQVALEECKKKLDGKIAFSGSSVEPAGAESTTPVILDNILSPPKSEIQTDDTNTATSSSPASDAHISSLDEQVENTEMTPVEPRSTPPASPSSTYELDRITGGTTAKSTNSTVFNGAIPKTGKPLSAVLNKKQAVRKKKTAVYKSEISDKTGIKLCIKKPQTVGKISTSGNKKERMRKASNTSALESDIQSKKQKFALTSSGEVKKTVSFASGVKEEDNSPPVQQSVWGTHIPDIVLKQIFKLLVDEEGCMPTLYRLSHVCSQWRQVALSPTLWQHLDLSGSIKAKHRTEIRLKWFLDNRCSACTELNLCTLQMFNNNEE